MIECRGLAPAFARMEGQRGAGTLPANRRDACASGRATEIRERRWRREGGGEARPLERPLERRADGGCDVHAIAVSLCYTTVNREFHLFLRPAARLWGWRCPGADGAEGDKRHYWLVRPVGGAGLVAPEPVKRLRPLLPCSFRGHRGARKGFGFAGGSWTGQGADAGRENQPRGIEDVAQPPELVRRWK